MLDKIGYSWTIHDRHIKYTTRQKKAKIGAACTAQKLLLASSLRFEDFQEF